MRRARTLVLLAATILVGCRNPHANRPAAELRPGITPITSRVKYEATYSLVRTDQPGEPLYSTRIARGEKVGFLREKDGSVAAVAGGLMLPLGEGDYAWFLVKDAAPSWTDRAAQDCRQATSAVGTGLAMCGLIVACAALTAAYAMANSPS